MFYLTVRGQLFKEHLNVLSHTQTIKKTDSPEGVEQFIKRKCHSSALFLFGQLTSIYQLQYKKNCAEYTRSYGTYLSKNLCNGQTLSSRSINQYLEFFSKIKPYIFRYKRKKGCKSFQYKIITPLKENQSFILLFEVGEKQRKEDQSIEDNLLTNDSTTLLILSFLLDKAASTYRNGYGGFWCNPHQLNELKNALNLSSKTIKNHLQFLVDKKVIELEKPTSNLKLNNDVSQSIYENAYVYFDSTIVNSYFQKINVSVTESGKKFLEYHAQKQRKKEELAQQNNDIDIPGYFVKPLPLRTEQNNELSADEICKNQDKFNQDCKRLFGNSFIEPKQQTKPEVIENNNSKLKVSSSENKQMTSETFMFYKLTSDKVYSLINSANDDITESENQLKDNQALLVIDESESSIESREDQQNYTQKECISEANTEYRKQDFYEQKSTLFRKRTGQQREKNILDKLTFNKYQKALKSVGKNMQGCRKFYDDFEKVSEIFSSLSEKLLLPINKKETKSEQNLYKKNNPYSREVM